MQKTKEKNHALQNAIGHIESIVEDYENFNYIENLNVTCDEDYEKQEKIRESILNSALSVEFRSGWYSPLYDRTRIIEPCEFKILLTWGTFWTDFQITENQQKALNWFCNCFYFGE